jgi:hypothetical protein
MQNAVFTRMQRRTKHLYVGLAIITGLGLTAVFLKNKVLQPENSLVRIVGLSDSTLIHFSYTLFTVDPIIKVNLLHDPDQPITEIAGSFSAKDSREVLVSVPYKAYFGNFSKLFLARAVENRFEPQAWLNEDCTAFSKIDLENDGLDELLIESQGIISKKLHYKIFKLLSLKGEQSKLIYERYSHQENPPYDYSDAAVGDTVSIWVDYKLIDIDNDKILELREVVTCSTIRELLSADSVTTTLHQDTLWLMFNPIAKTFK